jgi:dihydroflavonol-4-reductase
VTSVLVTGATGFIGRHVAQEFLGAGYEVVALVRRGGEGTAPAGCRLVVGDVCDRLAVGRAADGCAAIIHVAGKYSLARHAKREVMRTNVGGTATVVAVARATGANLVYTSSVATMGIRADGLPGDEDTPLRHRQTVGAYKRSKVDAERLVAQAATAGVWATIVNPTAPVGPGDVRPTPTGRIIRDALAGRMFGYVDTGLNLVDVRDVAAGHRLALERGVSGRRYILGHAAGNLRLRDIFAAVSEISGRPAPRLRIPVSVAMAFCALDEVVEGTILRREPFAPLDGARMARTPMFFCPDRAIDELGLPQSSVRAAIEASVDWFRRGAREVAVS